MIIFNEKYFFKYLKICLLQILKELYTIMYSTE